jgi:hypothetical protein
MVQVAKVVAVTAVLTLVVVSLAKPVQQIEAAAVAVPVTIQILILDTLVVKVSLL